MNLRRCLIVDTETTGVDYKKDNVVEIGAVLYSIENGGTLMQASTLIPLAPGLKNEAEEINNISDRLIAEAGEQRIFFKPVFSAMVESADVILAHKAEFDMAFLTGMDIQLWSSKPWLCTKSDFKFNKGKPGDSLINLTLAHGLGVASAHRALTDCQNLARILDTYSPAERDLLFAYALLPRDTYVALTTFQEKELAKARGFQWDGDKKQWTKRMTETEAHDITEFRIRKVVLSAAS